MPASHTITATTAAKKFSEILHHAHYSGSVIIEKNGKPFASISPIRTPLTGAQILRGLKRKPHVHLPPDEAEKFANDVESVRKVLNVPPVVAW